MYTWPGRSRAPSLAHSTSRRVRRCKTSRSTLGCPAERCITSAMGAVKSAGSSERMRPTARRPPAEQAIATRSNPHCGRCRIGAARRIVIHSTPPYGSVLRRYPRGGGTDGVVTRALYPLGVASRRPAHLKTSNRILAALPRAEFAALLSGADRANLDARTLLFAVGKPVRSVYF